MPKPAPGENRGQFVARCMADVKTTLDYPDEDERAEHCSLQFEPAASGRMAEAAGDLGSLGVAADVLAEIKGLVEGGAPFTVTVAERVFEFGGDLAEADYPGKKKRKRHAEAAKSTSTAGAGLPEIREDVAFTPVKDTGGEDELEAMKLARRAWPH